MTPSEIPQQPGSAEAEGRGLGAEGLRAREQRGWGRYVVWHGNLSGLRAQNTSFSYRKSTILRFLMTPSEIPQQPGSAEAEGRGLGPEGSSVAISWLYPKEQTSPREDAEEGSVSV